MPSGLAAGPFQRGKWHRFPDVLCVLHGTGERAGKDAGLVAK